MAPETCPVCNIHPILPPNGVCQACLERLRQNKIPPPAQIAAACEKRLRSFPGASEETLQRNIARSIAFHQQEWDALIQGGLRAAMLATILVDEADHLPTEREWHARRVAFVADLLALLPDALFAPVSRQSLEAFMHTAKEYWAGHLSEQQREAALAQLRGQLDKKTPPHTWDVKSLPLWMLQTEETFDWMWGQFMDCVYAATRQDFALPDTQWMRLYHTHFSDILTAWVQKGENR